MSPIPIWHADDLHRNARRELRRGFHTRLFRDQLLQRLHLFRRDADQKNVGHAGRGRFNNFGDQRMLHQVHREREHDSEPQRHKNCARLIALAI